MAKETATAPTTLSYGSATLYCYESTDNVYLDDRKSVGVDAFPFMLIYSGTGLDPFSGIMGFSRDYPFNGKAAAPRYYDYLAGTGAVPSNIFSLYISDTSDLSILQFGGSDIDVYSSDPGEAVTLNLDDSYYWTISVENYAIGATYNSGSVTTSNHKALFDSGTSLAYLPTSLAPSILSTVLEGTDYDYYAGIYYVDCDNIGNMPSVFLNINSYWFEIPSQTYVVPLEDAYGPYCILGFLSN